MKKYHILTLAACFILFSTLIVAHQRQIQPDVIGSLQNWLADVGVSVNSTSSSLPNDSTNTSGVDNQKVWVDVNNGLPVFTKLDQNTQTKPAASCIAQDVLDRYPETIAQVNRQASCAAQTVSLYALQYRLDQANIAVSALQDRLKTLTDSLSQISKINSSTFNKDPGYVLAIGIPAGEEIRKPVEGAVTISAQCYNTGTDETGTPQYGEVVPIGTYKASFAHAQTWAFSTTRLVNEFNQVWKLLDVAVGAPGDTYKTALKTAQDYLMSHKQDVHIVMAEPFQKNEKMVSEAVAHNVFVVAIKKSPDQDGCSIVTSKYDVTIGQDTRADTFTFCLNFTVAKLFINSEIKSEISAVKKKIVDYTRLVSMLQNQINGQQRQSACNTNDSTDQSDGPAV